MQLTWKKSVVGAPGAVRIARKDCWTSWLPPCKTSIPSSKHAITTLSTVLRLLMSCTTRRGTPSRSHDGGRSSVACVHHRSWISVWVCRDGIVRGQGNGSRYRASPQRSDVPQDPASDELPTWYRSVRWVRGHLAC